MDRKLTRAAVVDGAWLMKCNPKVWDIASFIEDGLTEITGWRVQDNYRIDLMDRGDRVFLWVTNGSTRVPSGIWARGTIAGDLMIADGDEYWVRPAEGRDRTYVGTDMAILSRPALKADLINDRRFRSAEVIRSPQMGNPLYVSGREVAAIEDALAHG